MRHFHRLFLTVLVAALAGACVTPEKPKLHASPVAGVEFLKDIEGTKPDNRSNLEQRIRDSINFLYF